MTSDLTLGGALATATPMNRRIQLRAYFHFENRTGARWWDPTANWAQAEREERSQARLTGRSVSAIWSHMINDGVVFGADWEILTRHFLAPFFPGNAFRANVAELRTCYLSIPGAITKLRPNRTHRRRGGSAAENKELPIPEDAKEFCRFIGREFLSLKELPAETLAQLYADASEDLARIDSHISECQRLARENGGDIRQGTKSRGRSEKADDDSDVDDASSRVRVFSYYADLNYSARDEIIALLSDRARMCNEALRAAHEQWLIAFDFHVPYSFRVRFPVTPGHRSARDLATGSSGTWPPIPVTWPPIPDTWPPVPAPGHRFR